MSCNVGLRLASSRAQRGASASYKIKSRWAKRNLHKRTELPYPIEGGLGDFLPPAALRTLAVDYQDGLLQRLNDEVRGTPDENASLVNTLINVAADSTRALTFNYASLALNNSYFLSQLKPPPPQPLVTHQTEISRPLASALQLQHGSIAQLKSAFSAAVTGMFTNGYVWFVTDSNGNMGIIPTFGTGTLLIRSRTYMGHSDDLELGPDLAQEDRGHPFLPSERGERQGEGLFDVEGNEGPFRPEHFSPEDFAEFHQPAQSPTAQPPPPGVGTQSPASGTRAGSRVSPPPPSRSVTPRFLHTSQTLRWNEKAPFQPVSLFDTSAPPPRAEPKSKTESLLFGEVLYPLFCISVHEHAWMSAGYGIWGKEEWLKKFWTVLDWSKISRQYEAIIKGLS